MSVDHYDCDVCGENGVYEELIEWCEDCGSGICHDCMIEKSDAYPFIGSDLEINEDGEMKSKYCPFCSGNEVSDSQRIDMLLRLQGETLEWVDKKVLEKRKAVKKQQE